MSTVDVERRQTNIWWLFLIQGSVGILVGIPLITTPGLTAQDLFKIVGLYWFITGIVALARFLVDRSHPWIWSIFTGIVGILIGLLTVRAPLLAALTEPTTFVMIFGVLGLAMGLLEIIDSFIVNRSGSFIVGLINGLIALLLFSSPMVPAPVLWIVFCSLLIVQDVALGVCAFRIGVPREAFIRYWNL